jgi:hypothetical protein
VNREEDCRSTCAIHLALKVGGHNVATRYVGQASVNEKRVPPNGSQLRMHEILVIDATCAVDGGGGGCTWHMR